MMINLDCEISAYLYSFVRACMNPYMVKGVALFICPFYHTSKFLLVINQEPER